MLYSKFDLNAEVQKACIDIGKNQIKHQARINASGCMQVQKELEREIRKSQCDVIDVQENGVVVEKTLNLRVKVDPRQITNLMWPEMIQLVNATKPSEYVWMLVGEINSQWNRTFLTPDRISSTSYLSKKMTELEAEFYANTYAEERWNVKKFVRKLIHDSSRHKWIPLNVGWFVDEDGKAKFQQKEDMTWSYVIEKIR